MLINIKNNLTQQQGIAQTYLAGTVNAGGSSAGVKNIAGFNNQYAVQIGQTVEAQTEILILSGAPSGTTMNFGTAPSNSGGTFLYPHAPDTPVYQIHYDQIIINRSTAGTAGPFTPLGTYNITPNQVYTQIDDPTGINTYAYYAQYYNSISAITSGSSAIFVPGGPAYYSLQAIRTRIKNKLYSVGFIRDDSVITDWINEAYEEMTNSAIKVNENYLMGSQTITFGTDGMGTITDDTYKQMIKLEVSISDNTIWIPSTEIAFSDFTEDDFFQFYAPRHAWRGENVFEILPHQQGGTVRAYYATRFTPLVNDSDTLTQTLKAYTRSFVEYGLAQAYGLDQQQDYDKHMAVFDKIKQDFVAEVTPRDVTGVKMIETQQNTSGINEDLWSEWGEFY